MKIPWGNFLKKHFYMALKKHTMLPVICLAAFLCCGCGEEIQPETVSTGDVIETVKITSMESTAIVNYAVPKLTPNVLVDLAGYQADGGKRAAVKGRQIPNTFRLVDADTGETVFTGKIEDGEYNAELNVYAAYADFDDWTQPGNYYLECDYIGRSYSFDIEENLYERLFKELCDEMFEECAKGSISLSNVAELILAYEWYPDIFQDNDGNRTPDVLDKIAAWIAATADQPVDAGEEALYAAALAKFSYLYQNYDRQYATDCLRRASVVYGRTQNTPQKDAECFYALTELYRATGIYTYNQQIIEYKTYFDSHANFSEEPGYLYGAMTYAATRRSVDMELCGLFMNTLMTDGEEISKVYKEMIYPVNARNNGLEDLLGHAESIVCANYVMNNYQYNHIMEEFLHYLRGRNQQSVDFCGTDTEDRTAQGYLLMLAQLAAVQKAISE